MRTPKISSLITVLSILWLSACNYAPEGEWWYRHPGGENSSTYVGAADLIPFPPIPLGGDRGLDAERPGGPLEANDPPPQHTKDGATEGLKDPRSGVGDAAGTRATSLSSSDAGSSKLPPSGWLTFVDITPASFPFVTTVLDDGTGPAGGWQVANVKLEFKKIRIPTTVITWWCRFKIEMPLRTEKMGRVDATRAASLSVAVTRPVAYAMDYDLPQGIFCDKFIEAVQVAFPLTYVGLGARVNH